MHKTAHLYEVDMKLKIMTFNIQHGRNHNFKGDVIDLPAMAQNVREQNPDICGFNEVRNGTEKDHSTGRSDQAQFFQNELGGNAKFGKAIDIQGYEYGNAIWSKHPFVNVEVIPIPEFTDEVGGYYENRCVIKSEYDFDGKKLAVLNSHFGLGKGEWDNAVATVLALAEKLEGPLVLMGDFNMTPDNPLIQKLATVFTDSHAFVGKDVTTFPSHAPDIRIDYIFVRDARVLDTDTVQKVVSDHFAITAEIEI